MMPETKARQQINQKFEQAGWVTQDVKQLNLSADVGVAVLEYSTDTGPADYVRSINRATCGVIEAKKDNSGENLTVSEIQTDKSGLQKAWGFFGRELDTLANEMNEELVA